MRTFYIKFSSIYDTFAEIRVPYENTKRRLLREGSPIRLGEEYLTKNYTKLAKDNGYDLLYPIETLNGGKIFVGAFQQGEPSC